LSCKGSWCHGPAVGAMVHGAEQRVALMLVQGLDVNLSFDGEEEEEGEKVSRETWLLC